MKRLLLLALVAILALGACAPAAATPQSSPEEAAPAEDATSSETVTIRYGIWDSLQQPAHEKMAEEFNKLHPNIKIQIDVVPWTDYWTKLQTAVAGGDAYDVFWMNANNFANYVGKDVLTDITPMIEADGVDMSVFPESLVSMYSNGGKNYGMPKDFDTIALFYNKQIFDEAGVAYPDETWTWDDLKAAAEKLTNDDHWGFAAINGGQTGYSSFIYQNGGQWLDYETNLATLNMSETCEALTFYESFIEEGLSPDHATMTASTPEEQLFPGGKIAMMLSGSWMAKAYSDLEFEVDVAPLPQGKQRATVIHGLGNVIWSKTQNPEAAWEWVKFLGSKEAQQIAAETGAVIPAYDGLADLWLESVTDVNAQVFIDELEYAYPVFVFADGKDAEAQDAILKTLDEAWLGNITVAEACEQATTAANEVIER
jgi:multiple sugar transport system substrate-binding protein